jgi:WASH complex subunit 7
MSEEYEYDRFDDGQAVLAAVEKQRTEYTEMAIQYATDLKGILENIGTNGYKDVLLEPIDIDVAPSEKTTIFQLVQTDNESFNKVIYTLSFLSEEMLHLTEEAQKRYMGPLLVFGDSDPSLGNDYLYSEGAAQLTAAKLVPLIGDLSRFVRRANAVVLNAVRQLGALFGRRAGHTTKYNIFRRGSLSSFFAQIGTLLQTLFTLDMVIKKNECLGDAWLKYTRMISHARKNPANYQTTEQEMSRLEKTLLALDGLVMDGYIFPNCIGQDFDYGDGIVDVTRNEGLAQQFAAAISTYVEEDAKALAENEEEEIERLWKLPSFYCLLFFYLKLYGAARDKKLLKRVVTVVVLSTPPHLPLAQGLVWTPITSFSSFAPVLGELLKDSRKIITDFGVRFVRAFPDRVRALSYTSSVWMCRMESNLANRGGAEAVLHTRIRLVRQGTALAHSALYLFLAYVTSKKELTHPDVIRLSSLTALQKAIVGTFHRRTDLLAESLPLMLQLLTRELASAENTITKPIESQIIEKKRIDEQSLDLFTACTLAAELLRSCVTDQRLAVLRLLFDIISPHHLHHQQQHGQQLSSTSTALLYQIGQLQGTRRTLRALSCEYLFFYRDVPKAFFKLAYEKQRLASAIQYVFHALQDVIPLLLRGVHAEQSALVATFRGEVLRCFRSDFIVPLQQSIERHLRMTTHTHITTGTGIAVLPSPTLALKPFCFAGEYIDINAIVSHYLDQTFYNLTTVALYDWKTYEAMRCVGRTRLGLSLTDVHLPGQTLEQGLDVLEIMRNIHTFVSLYNYNLNNQLFVERQADSKMLNTISIQHVANSIRTHGMGIINTTVNFAYQFLKRKFSIFSQFLFDDHIRSPLMKEINLIKQDKIKQYPPERAEMFVRDIRKLGVADGKSYLDRFRTLVTEIGNTVGYVRLVRNGGVKYCSDALKFVPSLKNIKNVEDLCASSKLSAETLQAAKNLDSSIVNLTQSFGGGFEYLDMLVKVFANEMRAAGNEHLRNFYIIVPALTVSFVDHLLDHKTKLPKKAAQLHADGYVFTDDGLAIGIAYILKLLNVQEQFDALRWFDSIFETYKKKERECKAKLQTKLKKDVQAAQYNLARVQALVREYHLLRFTFAGAKIFFDSEEKD